MKTCLMCRETKEFTQFSLHKGCIGGRNTRCKSCRNQEVRCKSGGMLGHNLLRYWPNLSAVEAIAEYERLHQLQSGLCAICRGPETIKNHLGIRRLAVDHDHKTGKIRGLLCSHCNTAIGKFKDKVEYLIAAAIYLGANNV